MVVLVRPGPPGRRRPAGRPGDPPNDCFDRLRDEHGDRFDAEVAARLDGRGRRRGARRARPGRRRAGDACRLRRGHPLGGHGQLRRPPRPGRRDQPAGPARVAAAVGRARGRPSGSRAGPPDRRVHRLRGRHPPGRAPERSCSRHRFSLDVDWAGRGGQRPAAPGRPPGRVPPSRTSWRASPRRPARSSGRPGEHLLAARAERLREDWVKRQLVEAGTARAQALGWPDAYPFTKALGERALVEHGTGRTARRRRAAHASCGPRSSSRRWPSPSRAGSGGSAWPSRSSSPTPGACSKEFPGRARGRHRRHPGRHGGRGHPGGRRHGARTRRARRSTTWPPASGTRCATASWSSWSRTGSPATPCTTSGASPSRCPSGRSPGAAGCSASCSGPPGPWRLSSGASASSRSGRAGRARRRGSRTATTLAKRALGYVELYGAYTETEARYRIDRLLALCESLAPDDRRALLLRPGGHRLGPLRPRRPPALGGRARPGPHPPGRSVVDRQTAARAGRSSPPTGTSPSSTSSTR